MQLIKLGGSLITVKGSYDLKTKKLPLKKFRKHNVVQVAKELMNVEGPLIIVHGAGSFGHPKAKKYGLDDSYDLTPFKRKGAAEVAADVRELNHRVLDVFHEHGLYCMPVPPNTTVTNHDGNIQKLELGPFNAYLKQGLIPITFGDLVPDKKRGISICSGDALMFELAKAFSVKRVIFAMDEDGVFDRNPKKHRDAKLYGFMSKKIINEWKKVRELDRKGFCEALPDLRSPMIINGWPSDARKRVRERGQLSKIGGEGKRKKVGSGDATGGIVGKVDMCKKISGLGIECMILNGSEKGLLKKALWGKKVKATYF